MTISLLLAAAICAIGFPLLRQRFALERSMTITAIAIAAILVIGTLIPHPAPPNGIVGVTVPPPVPVPPVPVPSNPPDATILPETMISGRLPIVGRGDPLIVVDGILLAQTNYGIDNLPVAATHVDRGERLRIHGWAVDDRTKAPGSAVAAVFVSGTRVLGRYTAADRPDVAKAVGSGAAAQSEYSIDVDTARMKPGLQGFHVAVVAKDGLVLSDKIYGITIR